MVIHNEKMLYFCHVQEQEKTNQKNDPVMYYYALRELNSQQPIRQFALPRPRITSAQEYGFF